MSRPKIRHLAIMVRDPDKVAAFYRDVFKMDVAHKAEATKTEGKAWFLTDGYMSLAILPQRLEGEAPCGLNHFGFAVEDTAEISEQLVAAGVEEPKKRPSTRPYAEYRGCDPEGNWFDISQHGYDSVETEAERAKRKELAGVGAKG
jgi:catechol 2,3-dioxygenase-like lactoylglutathione lyase family enzyme